MRDRAKGPRCCSKVAINLEAGDKEELLADLMCTLSKLIKKTAPQKEHGKVIADFLSVVVFKLSACAYPARVRIDVSAARPIITPGAIWVRPIMRLNDRSIPFDVSVHENVGHRWRYREANCGQGQSE